MIKITAVKGKTVYVGLSGGVDSAVSALILKESGAKVVGVFMKNWAGERGLQLDCPWEEDQKSAMAVAEHLGIEFWSYNFEKEYKKYVLDYFFSEYEAGRTPNPDILCNSEIKFKAFLEKALSEGADFIATGHYAGKELRMLDFDGAQNLNRLLRGTDSNKDQTYFLSGLNQQQLDKAIFPLHGLTKPQVRELAQHYKLPNATRKDSQGICFIGDLDVQEFLRKYIARTPGAIVDADSGKKIGEHEGLAFYTIGQREGLKIGGAGEAYYVVGKSLENNTLLVVQGGENPKLFAREVKFTNLHWLNLDVEKLAMTELNKLNLTASHRYRHPAAKGVFASLNSDKTGTFLFDGPQRALAPGQSLVLYRGEVCLGNAVIAS